MSVKVFSFASAPYSPDPHIVSDYFQFRERVFNQERHYGMPSFEGMEFDELDNPSALYFSRYGENGTLLGVIRMNPTQFTNYEQSMINNSFSETVDGPPPHGITTFEATRIGVAPELTANPALRKQVVDELILATLEVGLARGAERFVGIMPEGYWRSVYTNRGWDIEPLGHAKKYYGPEHWDFVTAAAMPINEEVLARVRERTGIHERVSELVPGLILNNVQTGKSDDRLAI